MTAVRSSAGGGLPDKILEATRGYAVGALALARGERTHKLVTFASAGGVRRPPIWHGPLRNFSS
jgi:hypothetical protein